MSEEPTDNGVRVTAEEQSRPVFRLLARAALLLAQAKADTGTEASPENAAGDGGQEGGSDA